MCVNCFGTEFHSDEYILRPEKKEADDKLYTLIRYWEQVGKNINEALRLRRLYSMAMSGASVKRE